MSEIGTATETAVAGPETGLIEKGIGIAGGIAMMIHTPVTAIETATMIANAVSVGVSVRTTWTLPQMLTAASVSVRKNSLHLERVFLHRLHVVLDPGTQTVGHFGAPET